MNKFYDMILDLSQWLYAMWIINISIWLYAIYVVSKYIFFIKENYNAFWENKVITQRLLWSFSGIAVCFMFLYADIWAMFYYIVHPLSPLEFFFYAFDAVVIRHLSDEADRFTTIHK